MATVAVVDYGMGNLHSIAKALQRVGGARRVAITGNPAEVLRAGHVVFPGVGAIRDCIAALAAHGLDAAIREAAASKPFLGICLGMQALLDTSEENGGTRALGILPGRVVRFAEPLTDASGTILKVPHMGWNTVHQTHLHPLWRGIDQDSRFYFVHSYHAVPACPDDTAATSAYPTPFTAALARENLFAVQFHPEKSQQAGLRLLENFLDWDGTL